MKPVDSWEVRQARTNPDARCELELKHNLHRARRGFKHVTPDDLWFYSNCIWCGNIIRRQTSVGTERDGEILAGVWHRFDEITDYVISELP